MTTNPRGLWHPPKSPADSANSRTAGFQPARPLTDAAQVAHHSPDCSTRRASFSRIALSLTCGWLFTQIALPVHAATLLNNSGIQFDEDTTLESNFVESHGAYQSTFGVINLDTKEKTPLLIETKPSDNPESIFKPSSRRSHVGTNTDFVGTPGNAVPKPTAQYGFKANQRYVLYLESTYKGRPTGIVYSTNVLNPNREQQVRFAGTTNDLCTSGITVGWDDTGSKLVRDRQQQDRDFDDFIVRMKSMSCGIGGGEPPAVEAATPPPPTVGALPSPVAGGGSKLWALAPLLALPFLFGGNDKSSRVDDSRIVLPTSPNSPNPNSPNPPSNLPNPRPPSCPSGNCQAVPEPLTILGSGSAIAMTALINRRRKRKRK